MSATSPTSLLKYANVQMAAEAIDLSAGIAGEDYRRALVKGNNRSSRFTDVDAAEFVQLWEVVEHKSNTATGFSGTLFKAKSGGGAEVDALRTKYGITAGELCLSFRSTEFADDAARDNQATNGIEIRPFGYALGQTADLKTWANSLLDTNKINANKPCTVTGYSLGGHVATAFTRSYKAITTNSIASYAASTRAGALKRFKGKSCRTPHLHAKSASSPYKDCAKRSQIHSKHICLTQFAAMEKGTAS